MMNEIDSKIDMKTDKTSDKEADPLVDFWKDPKENGFHLDVRALIEAGGEPYSIIMNHVREAAPESWLKIHAPFEPKPLLMQLQRMGFKTETSREGMDHFCVRVQPQ